MGGIFSSPKLPPPRRPRRRPTRKKASANAVWNAWSVSAAAAPA